MLMQIDEYIILITSLHKIEITQTLNSKSSCACNKTNQNISLKIQNEKQKKTSDTKRIIFKSSSHHAFLKMRFHFAC